MSVAYQPRDPSDARRIAELQEENAYLRRQLALELDAECVSRMVATYGLSPLAATIVAVLVQANGRVVSRGSITDLLPPSDAERVKMIDTYLCRIRHRLGREAVETVRGRGLRIDAAFLAQFQGKAVGG